MTAVGSVVFFEIGSDTLTPAADAAIKILAEQLRGKPQKIEVRGHVASEYAARTEGTDKAIMLGIQRAAAVRRLLVDREGLNPARFRISSAADWRTDDQERQERCIQPKPTCRSLHAGRNSGRLVRDRR